MRYALFMVKHLGLTAKGVLNKKTGVYDEGKNTLELVETMRNFKTLADLPKHVLKPGSVVSFKNRSGNKR